jgi:hypothetical protein
MSSTFEFSDDKYITVFVAKYPTNKLPPNCANQTVEIEGWLKL